MISVRPRVRKYVLVIDIKELKISVDDHLLQLSAQSKSGLPVIKYAAWRVELSCRVPCFVVTVDSDPWGSGCEAGIGRRVPLERELEQISKVPIELLTCTGVRAWSRDLSWYSFRATRNAPASDSAICFNLQETGLLASVNRRSQGKFLLFPMI